MLQDNKARQVFRKRNIRGAGGRGGGNKYSFFGKGWRALFWYLFFCLIVGEAFFHSQCLKNIGIWNFFLFAFFFFFVIFLDCIPTGYRDLQSKFTFNSNRGKYWPEKIPYLENFHAVTFLAEPLSQRNL